MKLIDRAKQVLWKKSGLDHDNQGYLKKPELNLLPDIDAKIIEGDYRKGSGHEWNSKFRAIHSSAALVANTFGKWKTEPAQLRFAGYAGFDKLVFEAKCPTGLGGTAPHLDVLLQSDDTVIGIESKFLEPLELTAPIFSDSYSKNRLPLCEDAWWTLLENVRQWPKSHLDASQLIKHYLGLRNNFPNCKNVMLVYLFWKPLNADKFEEYGSHAKELEKFQHTIRNSNMVQFKAMDYLQLWNDWEKDKNMTEHTKRLKDRYCVEI
ncbi:MAG: hypothetical protein GX155_09335 [Smithella sp.]|jgi:hypothetical protein|nr:hypothetical protein [Smithella sp.]